jgi:hypothetical protein
VADLQAKLAAVTGAGHAQRHAYRRGRSGPYRQSVLAFGED